MHHAIACALVATPALAYITTQVERQIGQLNESTRAALLASELPAYLWPEVYMAMCHTQNIVPSSALQRELKKKE